LTPKQLSKDNSRTKRVTDLIKIMTEAQATNSRKEGQMKLTVKPKSSLERKMVPSASIPLDTECIIETESGEVEHVYPRRNSLRINMTPQEIMNGPGQKFKQSTKKTRKSG